MLNNLVKKQAKYGLLLIAMWEDWILQRTNV